MRSAGLTRAATMVALTAATAVIAGVGAAPASATDVRPVFQMPFPCDEVRQGATYENHGGAGNDFPIDFNRGAGDDDLGDPVLASAAGTVRTWIDPDGDTIVRIDHNATWSSQVHHLSKRTVTDGQQVRQGDKIGEVGRSGTDSPHIHYAQLKNGVPAHLHFDGEPLNPGYSYTYNGPDYRSDNCPGRAPADVSVSGVADGDGSLTVFARRGGNLHQKNRRTDGSWGDWINRGGNLSSGPDAAVTGAGFYHVVARGENGKVQYKRQNSVGWSEWHTTFSDFDTPFAPAIVAVDGNTLIALAVRASDNVLLKRRYDATTGWDTDWSRLGNGDDGGYTSGPDASLRDGGKIDVVIRGAGGRVNHIVRGTEGTWHAPHVLGDLTSAVGAAPATASRQTGTVDVMARGEHGYLHRNTLGTDGTWSGWHQINLEQLNQGPDLVANTDTGDLQLLGRDTEGRLVRATWNHGEGWSNLNPIPTN